MVHVWVRFICRGAHLAASVVSIFVFGASITAASAQITIGQYTLETTGRSGPALSQRAFGSAGFALSFAEAVGGVNFQSAGLVDSANNSWLDVSVSYKGNADSNHHLLLKIHGSLYSYFLPDWELRPIVDFVDSGDTAVVSLFGDGPDRENYFYPTYEKSFANTLMGLRLLQADMFLMDPVGLRSMPATDGKIILGDGERVSNEAESLAAAQRLDQMMKSCECDSWILNDVGDKSEFSKTQTSWRLDGAPHYFFWHAKETPSEAERLVNLLRWETQHPNADEATEREYVRSMMAGVKRSLVQNDDSTAQFHDKFGLFLQANYPVFAAARDVMRFGAIFRASRYYHPTEWRAFVAAVDGSVTVPYLVTPTRIAKAEHH